MEYAMPIACPWCKRGFCITVIAEDAPPLPPDTPVDQLELTARALIALKLHHIENIGQLTAMTPAHLLRLQQISRTVLNQITAALAKHRLTLQPIQPVL